MKSHLVARGGLVTAAAVALLYIGALFQMPVVGAVFASAMTALPLVHHRVKLGVLVYLATSALSALLLPRKSVAVLYIGLTGLYALVKYAIENKRHPYREFVLKLVFFNVVVAVGAVLLLLGFLPAAAPVRTLLRLALLWLPMNAVFMLYDVGLSRLIALLGRLMPRE